MSKRTADPSKWATTACPTCGKVFGYRKSWPRKYCSNVCSGKGTVRNIKRWTASSFDAACETCGKVFRATPKRSRGRFCSRRCYGRWLSATIVGEMHPKYGKTGQLAHNKKPAADVTCRTCGVVFGVKPSQAPRRVCCSEACIAIYRSRSGRYSGENSPTWRGGQVKYYGPSWRPAARAARARDKVCQDCGISPAETGRALDVHHLEPFRRFGVERHEEANRLDNLVSLCQLCHLEREWATNRRHTA